jgi:hypothetical protein
MLKTKEEMNKELGKIAERDKLKIESVIIILQEISKNEELSEEAINKLSDSAQLLGSLSMDYLKRFIRIIKQNHMID